MGLEMLKRASEEGSEGSAPAQAESGERSWLTEPEESGLEEEEAGA
jgi:hypothetical protein